MDLLARSQLHERARRIDPHDRVDDQVHVRVQQRFLRPLELLGPLGAHRDVHVAGLVCVLPGRVDDRDLRLAPGDEALELSGDQVRGEGAPHPAAQDDDALHGPTGPS
jgi:hypothetical protein